MKEIFKEIQDYKYINETLYSQTRHLMTLNQPHFVNLYQLNVKKRKVNPISNRYINMENSKLDMLNYPLFVLNTCGDNIPTKNDYLHLSNIMKTRFPNATKYELENTTEIADIKNIEAKIDLLNNNNNSNHNNFNKIDNNANNNKNENTNIKKNAAIIEKKGNMRMRLNFIIKDIERDNEKDKVNKEIKNYAYHGYILLNILLIIIVSTKIKNIYEYDY